MKIYVACPYSHEDKAVMVERFHCANCLAGHLMLKGHVVFSPISMTHSIAHCFEMPKHWEFWQHQDTPFLDWCEAMAVLMLKGWEKSIGVTDEIKIIKGHGKPIFYIDYSNLETSIKQIP